MLIPNKMNTVVKNCVLLNNFCIRLLLKYIYIRAKKGTGPKRGTAKKGDAKRGTSMILCFYRQDAGNFKKKHKIIDVPVLAVLALKS